VSLDPSPLCCRSCRRRSWSGWGGIDQRDSIIDLRAAAGVKKRTSEARTGSEADRNPTPSAPSITKRLDAAWRITREALGKTLPAESIKRPSYPRTRHAMLRRCVHQLTTCATSFAVDGAHTVRRPGLLGRRNCNRAFQCVARPRASLCVCRASPVLPDRIGPGFSEP
jgi:hypothetical protein